MVLTRDSRTCICDPLFAKTLSVVVAALAPGVVDEAARRACSAAWRGRSAVAFEAEERRSLDDHFPAVSWEVQDAGCSDAMDTWRSKRLTCDAQVG